ncbi:L,D-transpeptidase [Streptomyces sp. NPDC020800]|uniref:L,D-transpeptidase n=1 Tax=Streptomyces sp. NPDC020800 TaxID=3365092 RepID=UPI00379BED34
MSDQLPPPPLTETELSARLRCLAAQGAAPATGAQARSRAKRRRRGRRVALCATALAAAALTAITSGALSSATGTAVPPAASVSRTPAPESSPVPVQRVTVDLDAYTLTIGGRRFSISGLQKNCPIGERAVTVTAKYPSLTMPPNQYSKLTKYVDVRRWAVTFTDHQGHQRLLMNALDPSAGLNSIGQDAGPGAIALSPRDGKRVYDAIRLGARVEIKGRQAASADPDSVCYERMPVAGDR